MDPIRTARPRTASQIFGIRSSHLLTFILFSTSFRRLYSYKNRHVRKAKSLLLLHVHSRSFSTFKKTLLLIKNEKKLFSHRPSEKRNMKTIFFIFCMWSSSTEIWQRLSWTVGPLLDRWRAAVPEANGLLQYITATNSNRRPVKKNRQVKPPTSNCWCWRFEFLSFKGAKWKTVKKCDLSQA